MIETPLDTLGIRRETFVKSLYDGIGVSEAAGEYLEAHEAVIKADLYYQQPRFEPLLLDVAKSQDNPMINDPVTGQLSAAAGGEGQPQVDEVNTRYQGQLQYLPEFAQTMNIQGPVQENPHLQPLFEEVNHTFHDGVTRKVPKYIAHNFNYYEPSNDHSGRSPADYDNIRLGRKYNWGNKNPDEKTVFTEGIFQGFPKCYKEPTINHHESNPNPKDESVRHMLENRYLEDIKKGNDPISLKDVLLGTTHLPAYRRKMLYDRILELGGIDQGAEIDRDEEGNYGSQGMPFTRMVTSLYKKAVPLFRKLILPSRSGADNQHGAHETLPEDYRTQPHAIYNSLRDYELEKFHMGVLSGLGYFERDKQLINFLANKELAANPEQGVDRAKYKSMEAVSRWYDLPKYDSKANKFTVEPLGRKDLSRNRWHESVTKGNLSYNGLIAGLHYDKDQRELLPYLNKDNPSGLKFDPMFEIPPQDIGKILSHINKTNETYYDGRKLRNNSASLLHPHVASEDMPSWMHNDNRSLTHFFTQMLDGIAGHGLEPNNAMLVMAHIFQHGDGNLLFDMNHPDDKHNYIHPKAPVGKDAEDAKLTGGALNALGFMGQQQQHMVYRPYFDPQAVIRHMKSWEADKGQKHPSPIGYRKVPVNHPANSLNFGFYDSMSGDLKMQVDVANEVRSNAVPSFALSVGTPAHTGVTKAGHELKQIPTMSSRNPEADIGRLLAHRENAKGTLDVEAGKTIDRQHMDVLRHRGESAAIDGTDLHSNTDIRHIGEVEHHDKNIYAKNRKEYVTGVMTGEKSSPLFPQATHTVDLDSSLVGHHGDKLVTDMLRRDPVHDSPRLDDVNEKQDLYNDATGFLEANKRQLLDLSDEMKNIQWQLDSKQNPEHVRNFEQRDNLQQRLEQIKEKLGRQKTLNAQKIAAQNWLNRTPRHDINELFEMLNDRIDGVAGLEGGRLEQEHGRYKEGKRGAFKRTRGREKSNQAVAQADLEATTSIAENERDRWIDSQGLSFGDPSNIPLYLGNLGVYMKAMERRLHSEDTGEKYETLQNHFDKETGVGHTKKTPIKPKGKQDGKGTFNYLGHHGSNGSNIGLKASIKPVYDSHNKLVGFENVEPYDFIGRTLTRPMYKQVGHEYEEMWGGNMDSGEEYGEEFGIEGGHRTLVRKHDIEDAALLLASLSDPDIMLKKDGDYPILQPMHRIFKLEDMEHLRGFSGDWIVSAMPEGPRAFVERDDDKVTVRGDFDLDKDTKENFTKISKKNFVVDVVFANKEYNVIDIVEYDDGNVNDMPLQERIKILRGTMESTENVLVPAAHNLRLTDDVGLEIIVKDLLKEHDRLMLRDANSTYMKGEARHPKWVLYDEGRDVNLMVLDKKGTSSYTYRLGTGPITHEDSLGDRAVKYEGETYMDVGTSFQTKDKYEVGDIVTVNVDSVSVTENLDGADIYTVNSNEIKGEAEGEGVSSVETLSLFTKSEPMMWPHEIDRDGDRIVIKMAAGDVSYRASAIDDEWYMFNPKAENGWLIRLAESQRPFWSPVAGVMLKADLSVIDDETKAEVHESKGDGKPLIPPKKVTGTNFWDDYATDKAKIRRLLAKSLNLVSTMLKSSVGAVGDASSGAQGLGMGYATPIESPSGPTELVGSKTLPDHDVRDIERDNKERAEDKKFNRKETPEGELSIERGKAAFVPY